MKEGAELLVVSDDISIVEKAYNTTLVDGKVWIDGIMSRKKQVVPPLQDTFA